MNKHTEDTRIKAVEYMHVEIMHSVLHYQRYIANSPIAHLYMLLPVRNGYAFLDEHFIDSIPNTLTATIPVCPGFKFRVQARHKYAAYKRRFAFIINCPDNYTKWLLDRRSYIPECRPPVCEYPRMSLKHALAARNDWLYHLTGGHDYHFPQ